MDTSTTLRFSNFLRRKLNRSAGFSRIELLASLACLALLSALALPALATSQSRSQVVQCLNNLRQMGHAVQMWGAEQINEPSWQTYDYQGGTRPLTGQKPGNAWYEFSWMSNELVTPRILACPSDATVLVARDFREYAGNGLFRANATSYFLNLHTTFEYPHGPLFGDLNVRFFPQGNCEFGVNSTVSAPPNNTSVGWTNAVHDAIHGFQGNIVRVDGTTELTTSEELRSAFRRSDRNELPHFLRGGP